MAKKAKKQKNIYENVKINQQELTPTTIGTIDENENNLKFVLILFFSLIVIIFALPYFMNWLDSFKEKSVTPSNTPQTSTNEDIKEEEPAEEQYLELANKINTLIDNYRFVVNYNNNILDVTITNESGAINYLVNNPIFIEVYSQNKMLMQRFLIDKEELILDNSTVHNFIITNNLSAENTPTYLVIANKNANDYPAIDLKNLDSSGQPFLTCTKSNETIIYTFKDEDKGYLLTTINDTIRINDNSEETINTYSALANSYQTIPGIEADINPETTGFSFSASINLNNVKISEHQRILNNKAFYELNTPAKSINFELSASGYQCK